ncbi:hypothetical protein EDD86DRAFT_188384, partial [Gorgonomyces haynaldii]
KNQPFCDGSHRSSNTGIKPLKFTVSDKKTYWLCGCRQSGSIPKGQPFCDGTHSKEKGVKKYNEFLLKRNTQLKADLEQAQKSARFWNLIAGATLVAGVAVAAYKLK